MRLIYLLHIVSVPFQQALGLVSTRSVYLQDGYAFIPVSKLLATVISRVSLDYHISILCNLFSFE